MVIDSSALIAIVLGESAEPELVAAINRSGQPVMSTVSVLESGIVLRARRGSTGVEALYRLLEESAIQVVPYHGHGCPLGHRRFRPLW